MKLHIDKTPYKSKPKKHISIIKPRLQSNNTICNVTLQELIQDIKSGCSISPAIMNGGAKAENWQEQTLFMVDIDNDNDNDNDNKTIPILTPSEALAICEQNNLLPVFYYYSFSHTEDKPKYRLCFVCDEVIKDTKQREIIINTLINLFPQSDTSCKNADRIFYGTNKDVIIYNENALISFENILNIYEPPQEKNTVKKQNITDNELTTLKDNFDFLEYLKSRSINGNIAIQNQNYVMFEGCEICRHKKDLVYYYKTNTVFCFHCGERYSIIDYIIVTQNKTVKEAIEHFKYDLCKVIKKEYTPEQKRDFAIKKQITINEDIISKLQELYANKKYSLNDKGFGELFADLYKDYCRFNVNANKWYVWNDKVWIEDTGTMQVSQKAKEFADALLIYATSITEDTSKKNYLDYVCKLGQLRYRETIIKDARDEYFIKQTEFDKNLDLFNCQNGTLNLKTFEFTEHKASDLLSKISNVVYDENATAPIWDKFIDDVMQGNTDKKEYLQKILGYSITADTSLETCFILYGATTRNGKSTLVETIAYMLGNNAGYAITSQPQTLAQKQNKDSRQHSSDVARLQGSRFVNVSEPTKRMIFDVAQLKQFLGRDTLPARFLFERDFEFQPHFKLFINTNFLPLITDDTLFSSGRLNVISFDKHFEPNEQNKTLKDQLRKVDNISGIFNWCIEGLKMFYKEGATPPQAILQATQEYRTNSDKLGNFISECLKQTGRNSKALDVYIAYKKWCELNGFGCENKGNFFDELRGKNIFAKAGTINGKTQPNVVLGYEIIVSTIEDTQIPNHSNKKASNF